MDYIGEVLALGVDSIILALCLRQYYKQRNTIQSIQGAPFLEINQDLVQIVDAYPEKKIPYVVLRGTVKSLGLPISSNNNPNVNGVVQKLTISEHVVARASAGFWSEQTRALHVAHNSTPFALGNKEHYVEVVDALSADRLDMDVVWDHFEPSHLSIFDHMWGFFSGVRQRGLQSTEEMLREGALITGIGELTRSYDNGPLKLQLPKTGQPLFLTTLTRGGLIKKLHDSQSNIKTMCFFLGCVGTIFIIILSRKYIVKKEKYLKDLRMRERLERSRRERRTATRDKNLPEPQLCIVCVQNPKEIILLPCGHVCICEDCSGQISDTCPVCRETIEQRAAAYIT